MSGYEEFSIYVSRSDKKRLRGIDLILSTSLLILMTKKVINNSQSKGYFPREKFRYKIFKYLEFNL